MVDVWPSRSNSAPISGQELDTQQQHTHMCATLAGWSSSADIQAINACYHWRILELNMICSNNIARAVVA
jgi:hypothetical protein